YRILNIADISVVALACDTINTSANIDISRTSVLSAAGGIADSCVALTSGVCKQRVRTNGSVERAAGVLNEGLVSVRCVFLSIVIPTMCPLAGGRVVVAVYVGGESQLTYGCVLLARGVGE